MNAIEPAAPISRHWLDYFSREKAIESVAATIAKLGSSRTPEQSTAKVYRWGLNHLLNWLGDRLPTEALMTRYIAELVQQGLARSTIEARHMAVAKHYLKALAKQQTPGLMGAERVFVDDCARQIAEAAQVKPPAKDTTSHIPALWDPRFKRLKAKQVKKVLKAINRQSLIGLRDYALLRVGFTTGLRLAELQRLTLNNITRLDKRTYLIVVRGKRNNTDPVSMDRKAHKAIQRYIKSFNRHLGTDDARRIQHDIPVWQIVHRYGRPYPLTSYDPRAGMSRQAIRDVIQNRTEQALGPEWRLSPHDLRRTFAAMAYKSGMPLEHIQRGMRHSSIETTMHYIGAAPDYEQQTLGHRVVID